MTDEMVADQADRDVSERSERSERGLGWLLTIGGVIGLLSAAMLIIEKITFLQNTVDGKPTALGCDINPIVGCGSVINTDQASVFGFPNPLMGLAGFAIVATIGVLLLGRVALPSFAWLGLQAGTIFGIGFVTWLQYQSIYNINALCPYCMVVWAVTIPIFVWVTARNLRVFAPGNPISGFVSDWTLLINILWYLAVVAAAWFMFGSDLWA